VKTVIAKEGGHFVFLDGGYLEWRELNHEFSRGEILKCGQIRNVISCDLAASEGAKGLQ